MIRYRETSRSRRRNTEARNAIMNDRRNILKRLFSFHSSKQSTALQDYASRYSPKDRAAARKLKPHYPEVCSKQIQSDGEQNSRDREAGEAYPMKELDCVLCLDSSLIQVFNAPQRDHPAYSTEYSAYVHGSETQDNKIGHQKEGQHTQRCRSKHEEHYAQRVIEPNRTFRLNLHRHALRQVYI